MTVAPRLIASRDRRTEGGIDAALVPTKQTGSLTDNQHGTNDTLILGAGTGPSDLLRLSSMATPTPWYDDARGGNDTLTGGANADIASTVTAKGTPFHVDNSKGGNDTLIGGGGAINFLNGDVLAMSDNARGGNDRLIAGAGRYLVPPLRRRRQHVRQRPRRQRSRSNGGHGTVFNFTSLATPPTCPATPSAATTR